MSDKPEELKSRIAQLVEQIIAETIVDKLKAENWHLQVSLNDVLERAAVECERVATMLRTMKVKGSTTIVSLLEGTAAAARVTALEDAAIIAETIGNYADRQNIVVAIRALKTKPSSVG
jgi:hypothetical protein